MSDFQTITACVATLLPTSCDTETVLSHRSAGFTPVTDLPQAVKVQPERCRRPGVGGAAPQTTGRQSPRRPLQREVAGK